VQVSWKCPVTGHAIGTSTAAMTADPSLTSRVGASVSEASRPR